MAATAISISTIRSMASFSMPATSRSMRLDAGFLGDARGERAVAGDEFDEGVARTGRGLDRAVDEIAPPPVRHGGDPLHLIVQPLDDRQRRAGRREQPEPRRRTVVTGRLRASVGMSGNSGERAVRVDREAGDPAAPDCRSCWTGRETTIGVEPATTALTISLPLRNGTRTMSMPLSLFNLSMKYASMNEKVP